VLIVACSLDDKVGGGAVRLRVEALPVGVAVHGVLLVVGVRHLPTRHNVRGERQRPFVAVQPLQVFERNGKCALGSTLACSCKGSFCKPT